MSPSVQSPLQAVEGALAAAVVGITAVTFAGVQPYPAWPTVGSVPVNPELVVPGLLGVVVLLRVVTDGLDGWSLCPGVLAAVTVWLAADSTYFLYAGEGGGVFWGGFLTLVAGLCLVVALAVRAVVRASLARDVPDRVRSRFAG